MARRDGVNATAYPVREGWEAGALTVFVSGRPRNPSNGSHGHWTKHARWAKSWRDCTASSVLDVLDVPDTRPAERAGWPWGAKAPKKITFTIYGASRFDDDNVRAVCKPVRDGLKDMHVIDDDRPSAGHVFEYSQAKPTRKAGSVYGISIRIELKGAE